MEPEYSLEFVLLFVVCATGLRPGVVLGHKGVVGEGTMQRVEQTQLPEYLVGVFGWSNARVGGWEADITQNKSMIWVVFLSLCFRGRAAGFCLTTDASFACVQPKVLLINTIACWDGENTQKWESHYMLFKQACGYKIKTRLIEYRCMHCPILC